jgi:hypothetical protein
MALLLTASFLMEQELDDWHDVKSCLHRTISVSELIPNVNT